MSKKKKPRAVAARKAKKAVAGAVKYSPGFHKSSKREAEPNSPSVATEFLNKLRPAGPWVLTAIMPDGPIETTTVRTPGEVDAFINANDGKRNLYYSVNPTRTALTKKAAKTDIAAIEFALADLDPADGEAPDAAKARYLRELESTFEPKPTAIVDSGNGIQCLWKLENRILLGEPIWIRDDNGRDVLAFSPEAHATIADVEGRIAAAMLRLGGKAGTQNIDRIMRLPGATNLPNKKKREAGRAPCSTKLISFNGAAYPLAAFPPTDAGADTNTYRQAEQKRDAVNIEALPVSERIKNLIRGIDDPEHEYPSRSERVMAVLVAMAAGGCTDEQMSGVMLDKTLPIGEHVREQSKLINYLQRQIRQARAKAGNPTAGETRIRARPEDVLKSAADLQKKTFEPLRWIVPKYLPEGTSILGGRPKIGKSWWVLDIAVGVATGGICLGEQCEQGDVLALMLEDSDRRIQRRLTKMLGAQAWPARLTYATGWPFLNDAGLDWIREWISKAAKPRLIIIDILQRIRERVRGSDRKSQYAADYDALITLQELGAEAQLSIVVCHHQRKQDADDLIDTLSGTLGLGGAVDAVLILGKDPQFENFLYGRGRDLEEFNVSVKQDEQRRWQVLGPKLRQPHRPSGRKSSQRWHMLAGRRTSQKYPRLSAANPPT